MSDSLTKSFFRIALFFVIVVLISGCQPPPEPTPEPSPTPIPDSQPPAPPDGMYTPSGDTRDNRFGMTWISSFYNTERAQGQIEKAVAAGATWDRWPAYWYWVEQPTRWGEGMEHFHWSGDFSLPDDHLYDEFDIDQAAESDAGGLQTLAILDGIPRLYDCAYEASYPGYPYGSRCYGTTSERIEGLSLDAADGTQP